MGGPGTEPAGGPAAGPTLEKWLQKWGFGGLVVYVLLGCAVWPLVWTACCVSVVWLCVKVLVTYMTGHPQWDWAAALATQRVMDVEVAVAAEVLLLWCLGTSWLGLTCRIGAEVVALPEVYFRLFNTGATTARVCMFSPQDPAQDAVTLGLPSASPLGKGKATVDNAERSSSRTINGEELEPSHVTLDLAVGTSKAVSGTMRDVFRAEVRDTSQHVLNTPGLEWLRPGAKVAVKRYQRPLSHAQTLEVLKGDLQMQVHAARYAEAFNARTPPPPKRVTFAPAAVVALDGWDGPVWIEPWLQGKYVKHSSNNGYVRGDRLTPEAFSHSTYAASKGELVVVDLQGVGDVYTDPQIHTELGLFNKIVFFWPSDARNGYGLGNLKAAGIASWRNNHECNAVCKHLGLPPLRRDDGTSTVAKLPGGAHKKTLWATVMDTALPASGT